MTVEIAEKMISTLAGLKGELYGIKAALIIIAVCAVFLTIITILKDNMK